MDFGVCDAQRHISLYEQVMKINIDKLEDLLLPPGMKRRLGLLVKKLEKLNEVVLSL